MAWPQAGRIVAGRDVAGVSALSWLLLLSACITWLTIGLTLRIPFTIAYNVLAGASTLTVLGVIGGHRPTLWVHTVATGAGAALINVAVYAIAGPAGTSILGVTLSMTMFMPQAITAVRHPGPGISTAAWSAALITAATWGLYGLLIHQWVLVIPNVVMIPLCLVIIQAASRDRRQRSQAQNAHPVP